MESLYTVYTKWLLYSFFFCFAFRLLCTVLCLCELTKMKLKTCDYFSFIILMHHITSGQRLTPQRINKLIWIFLLFLLFVLFFFLLFVFFSDALFFCGLLFWCGLYPILSFKTIKFNTANNWSTLQHVVVRRHRFEGQSIQFSLEPNKPNLSLNETMRFEWGRRFYRFLIAFKAHSLVRFGWVQFELLLFCFVFSLVFGRIAFSKG